MNPLEVKTGVKSGFVTERSSAEIVRGVGS